MPESSSDRYAELLSGSYDCVDRIVLNAYFRMGHGAGGFRVWWRALSGSEETLDNTHLMRKSAQTPHRSKAMLNGTLRPGARLPSSRSLALGNRLSRSTGHRSILGEPLIEGKRSFKPILTGPFERLRFKKNPYCGSFGRSLTKSWLTLDYRKDPGLKAGEAFPLRRTD